MALVAEASGQAVSYAGGTLSESFDGMGRLGTSTPAGWFVGLGSSATTPSVTPGMGLQAPSTSIAGWNLGSTNGLGTNSDTDRALGSGPTGAGNDGMIEVRIVNNSGQAINAFEVRYDGEEWRTPQGASPVDQLVLQFSTNGTTFIGLGGSFDFIRPVTSPATTALDGNQAANRIVNCGGLFAPPAPIPAGATFYLRWFDANDSGITDALLAIDNFRFTAVSVQSVAIVAQPQSEVRTAGESVTFTVGASGVPVHYQWLRDGVPISGATGSNYTVTATTNLSGSGFSVIVSNSLNSVTSRVAMLTVYPSLSWPLVSLTSAVWKYNQSGADLGIAWREPGYDDAAWPAGRGVLAQENHAIVNPLTNTVLSLTKPSGEPIITYYFRSTFNVTNPAAIASMTFSNLIDDGCVVYLNGRELYRIKLPSGVVVAGQLADTATEGAFVVKEVPAKDFLVTGTNVLAVEVHQASTNSTDVVMGVAVKANPWNSGPVTIVQAPRNLTVNPGGEGTVSGLASGYPPLAWQWRFNSMDIPGATNAELVLTNVTLAMDGFYWAVVSNGYGAVTSSPARVRVAAGGLTTFYQCDFNGGRGSEWTSAKIETTPFGAERFLGQFSSQAVSLRLTNLPPHTNVAVSFDLFVIQTWNGNGTGGAEPGPDIWRVGVAGGPVLVYTTLKGYSTSDSPYDATQAFPGRYPNDKFPGRSGADETNTLGYTWDTEIMDTVYRQLTYSFNHSGGSVQIDFSDGGLQGIGDESWGLDNVKVYLDNGSVAGWPVVFNPSSTRVGYGQFRFGLTGLRGAGVIVLEASSDLRQWDAISTNAPSNGALSFMIPIGAHPYRFFRAKQ